jgi:hypothetical protein
MQRQRHGLFAAAAAALAMAAGLGEAARVTGLAPEPRITTRQHDKRQRFLPGLTPNGYKPCGSRNPRTRKKKHRCVKPVRRWKRHAK